MGKLTTAAWVVHDLGLAACFGGQLFGKYALNSRLGAIESESDRGKLLNEAWNSYNAINAVSLGAAAATWFTGRAAISGDAIDGSTRGFVLAKDALILGSAATGVVSMISGKKLADQAPEGAVPIATGTQPSARTPDEAAKLLRTVNSLGNASLVLTGAAIAVSSILSMKSAESAKWSAVTRFLP